MLDNNRAITRPLKSVHAANEIEMMPQDLL